MADYGALLALPNGAAFITPQSTPLALYTALSVSSQKINDGLAQANVVIPVPDTSQPVIPFVITSKPSQGGVALSSVLSTDGLAVSGNNIFGNSQFTMTVYVFTFFQQPMPNPPYGMAVWDENRRLILTHETKVLTDMQTIGSWGNAGGTSIDVTLPGRWAIVPACCGQTLWQFNNGGPGGAIIPVPGSFGAMFDGANTRIAGQPSSYPGGQAQTVGTINAGNPVIALEVSKYF